MKMIPFSRPDVGDAEAEAVSEAIHSLWITTGPKVRELEKRLACFVTGDEGCERAVCLNSATAAEEMLLRILGVGPGDEVIVPAYTYTATVSAVVHCGATPVMLDIRREGSPLTRAPEMDYDRLADAVTERTKAVIAVDIGGLVCDYERLFDVAESTRHLFRPMTGQGDVLSSLGERIQKTLGRVAVLADCAHSLGGSRCVRGKWLGCGNLADFSTFSFHAVKNFTTAEGGAALWRSIPGIPDEEIRKMLQLLSLHGQDRSALSRMQDNSWEYDIIGPWYKCNMTDLSAAMGLRQLDRYPEMIRRRRELIARYDRAMDEIGIWHVRHETEDMKSSAHLYMTRLPGRTEAERNAVISAMAERGVMANVHFKPLPMMTAYRRMGFRAEDYPNAWDYYRNEITLPLYSTLGDEDVDRVIAVYTDIVKDSL